MIWETTRFSIDLSIPKVMGIVNVTPDSFSDGGLHFSVGNSHSASLRHCDRLVTEGADILDIGGESSRPGAKPVSLAEELERVLPVVRHAVDLGVPVSVDTCKPEVMQAVLALGADIINDIWALRQPGALAAVAAHLRCGVCLMHMHREPQTMQAKPMQGDAMLQVMDFLGLAVERLQSAGIRPERIVLDPGVGFGKSVEQNFDLLARQAELLSLGYPLLTGWSRKSSLGVVGNEHPDKADRLVPSIAAALLAVERGARIVRVHNVRETVQALKVWVAASRSLSIGKVP